MPPAASRAPRVRQLLDCTAQTLRERGLAKNTHRAPNGTVCWFGALELAREVLGLDHDDACAAAQAAYDARGGHSPAATNDLAATTLDDMLELCAAARQFVA